MTWKGEAKEELTVGQHGYGGLSLRICWKEGIDGEVINSGKQKIEKAEGQRANWINVAMQVKGRGDRVNVSLSDHLENRGYPNKWCVDSQRGVAASYTRGFDWVIPAGKTVIIKHELVVHTGTSSDLKVNDWWGDFSGRVGMYKATELWRIAQKEGRKAKFRQPQEAVDAIMVKVNV